MRKIRISVCMEARLDLAPIAVVIANPLAPRANRNESAQRLDLLQRAGQMRGNAPKFDEQNHFSRERLHHAPLRGGDPARALVHDAQRPNLNALGIHQRKAA